MGLSFYEINKFFANLQVNRANILSSIKHLREQDLFAQVYDFMIF